MEKVDPPRFVAFEEEVMEYWEKIDAFREQNRRNKERNPDKEFYFYDGPPFATGLPHYGHIVAGTIKDVVTRYWASNGYHVERRFGWDCHGLPIEYEIDKLLGIRTTQQVYEMGIGAYNEECRKIVMRYSAEWRTIVTRLGRWIDFDNDYKTMNKSFMESVWWLFAQLHKKGYVYQGFKVMPYSTACATPLSNFEVSDCYKDVVDQTVIVTFPIVSIDAAVLDLAAHPGVSFVAWTTTPWTLPSNLALIVNAEMQYVLVRELQSNRLYVLMEARLVELYPPPKKAKKSYEPPYEVVKRFTGAQLVGATYEPIFDYFREAFAGTAFRVISAEYVTESSGTGIVHAAPFFGEDDYAACMSAGVIEIGGVAACPVDDNGRFRAPVDEYAGQHVKEADKAIIRELKSRGRVVLVSEYRHSYPFCWRSDTPLIYKAVQSWFVRVEPHREALLRSLDQTYWVPDYVKDKRMREWLKNARDWAVSRNRFWGTPLPVWLSDDGEEVRVIGSAKELQEAAGLAEEPADLHRHFIDEVTIPSARGEQFGVLRRVPFVFDCWFESGSMPYAQKHYPFENKESFERSFPADFIAEGLDQTRGWFYTLLVMSTLVFERPAFKNLIVNGMVLAEDGKKMSKRLKNYPDVMDVVNKYGADALRMYLMTSAAVKAEPLRFAQAGVLQVIKDTLNPWYNAYRFLSQAIALYEQASGERFEPVPVAGGVADLSLMDVWILSRLQSLVAFVREEMQAYRLYTSVPVLTRFIDDLTNWYVRLNRGLLKGQESNESGDADAASTSRRQRASLSVLHRVLVDMCVLMAPYTPFLCEKMYRNLTRLHAAGADEAPASVHFAQYPQHDASLAAGDVERRVDVMRQVIELARVSRERRVLPLKLPLRAVRVVSTDEQVRADAEALAHYIITEMNVKEVDVGDGADLRDQVELSAMCDGKLLGKKLGKQFRAVREAVAAWTSDEVTAYMEKGEAEVCGQRLCGDEVIVSRRFLGEGGRYEAAWGNGGMIVLIDTETSDELLREGDRRELQNRVQRARKAAGLESVEYIDVLYRVADGKDAARITALLGDDEQRAALERATKCHLSPLADDALIGDRLKGDAAGTAPCLRTVYHTVDTDVSGATITLTLCRRPCTLNRAAVAKKAGGDDAVVDELARVVALWDRRALASGHTPKMTVVVAGKTLELTVGDSDKCDVRY